MPDVLAQVGPRLKRVRTRRSITLTSVAAKTGISKSTLSRLESGQRKPSLELLLPLAEVYQVPLDELVGAPEVGDPRVRFKPRTGMDASFSPSRSSRADSRFGRSSSRPNANAPFAPTTAMSGFTCFPARCA